MTRAPDRGGADRDPNGPSRASQPDAARRSAPDADAAPLAATLYAQLRAAARQRMGLERADHTLTATALVHEAYLKLAGPRELPIRERAHFYAAAVEAMRQVLLDHGKARGRAKRGGGAKRVDLDAPIDLADEESPFDALAMDEAIARLAARDPRMAEIVRLRFYAGLAVAEVADVVGVSVRTVKSDWSFARAWLARELASSDATPGGGSP